MKQKKKKKEKPKPKKNVCEAEEREGEAEARLLEGSQYVQKAEGSMHDVLRVDLSWV